MPALYRIAPMDYNSINITFFDTEDRNLYRRKFKEKLDESLGAVLPIIGIVLLLAFTIAPLPPDVLLCFLSGAVLVVGGMMMFNVGAETAMGPIGSCIGARLTKTRRPGLILLLSFLLGLMITVSEPDLQVLAAQVSSVPDAVLILCVGIGVGLFMIVAILRMLLGFSLRTVLLISYGIVFTLSAFAPADFLAIAFDSGGVTTGPMTVPFIMTFGIGICSIRSDGNASDDSFGLVALCSIGPMLAVLVLSLFYSVDNSEYAAAAIPRVSQTVEMGEVFIRAVPGFMKEIAVSLLPIVVFFIIFQTASHQMDRPSLRKINEGIVFTYAGLVIFLTGVNVGFMPTGLYLGGELATLEYRWIIVPVGMLIGWFVVKAEPAVYVLMKQVEEMTNGAITGRALQRTLSAGVAVSIGISMLRVLTGISVMWFILPGYLLALGLSFFVPKIFTAVAFDSGGVASGPMTATFILPFAAGVCASVGGNIITDAFGLVAMVAMTPLIAIQILGIVYGIRTRGTDTEQQLCSAFDMLDDYAIIDF